MINHNASKDCGRLPNPWKVFLFGIAAEAVGDVNAQRDADGLTYARNAMIICGMALNTNRKW